MLDFKRSNQRVKKNAHRTANRIEIEVRNVAKDIAHHGPDELAAEMRRRGIAIDNDWSVSICKEYGWKPGE